MQWKRIYMNSKMIVFIIKSIREFTSTSTDWFRIHCILITHVFPFPFLVYLGSSCMWNGFILQFNINHWGGSIKILE